MPNSGEEWQVARRRKGAGRRGKIPHTARHEPGHADAVDTDRTKQRITETMAELRCADFWLEWRDRLTAEAKADSPEVGGNPAAGCDPGPEGGDRAREAPSSPLECVCYGLGSFSSCVTARYQLAMLLLILELLQRCSVYDPVFSSGEMEVLRQLGLTVLTENEAVCLCEEWPLPCPSQLLDVFNDTALITFNPSSLCKLPQSTWGEAPEPQYQHCPDLEIIQRDPQR
ncbi:unnamed protein product [Coregonus sp. 'balchen']|nr:unnamed protein product [Coregonus sp. 'balchen']